MVTRIARVVFIVASLFLLASRTMATVRAPDRTASDIIVSQIQQRRV